MDANDDDDDEFDREHAFGKSRCLLMILYPKFDLMIGLESMLL